MRKGSSFSSKKTEEPARSVSPMIKNHVERNFNKYLKEKGQKFPTKTHEPHLFSSQRTRTPPPSTVNDYRSNYSIYESSSVIKRPPLNRKVDIDKWGTPEPKQTHFQNIHPIYETISQASFSSIHPPTGNYEKFNTDSKSVIRSQASDASLHSKYSSALLNGKKPKGSGGTQKNSSNIPKETKKEATISQVMQLGVKRGAYGARLLMINRRFCLYDLGQCFGRWRLYLSDSNNEVVQEEPIRFQLSPGVIETLIKGLNVLLKFNSQRVTSHFLKWKHLTQMGFPFYSEEDQNKFLASQYFYKMVNKHHKIYLVSLYKRLNMKSRLELSKGGVLIKKNSFIDNLEKEQAARNSSDSQVSSGIAKNTEHLRVHFVDLYTRMAQGTGLIGKRFTKDAQTLFLHLKALLMVSRMVMASKNKLKTVHKMKVMNDMRRVINQAIKKRFLYFRGVIGFMTTEARVKAIRKAEETKQGKTKMPERFSKTIRHLRSYFIQKRFLRWRIHVHFCNQLEPVKAQLHNAINTANQTTENLQELIQLERKKAPEIFKHRCYTLLGSYKSKEESNEGQMRRRGNYSEPPLSEALENKVVLLMKDQGQKIMDEVSINLMKILIRRRTDPEPVIKKEMCKVLHGGVIAIFEMIINADLRRSFYH